MPDNKTFQKKSNISLVMQTIREKKEISRIEISRVLGLDRSTITNIVTKLIEQGLLVEKSQGTSESRGGRKPVLLGINEEFGAILGLEIQVNFYRATLLAIDGDIIWNRAGVCPGSIGILEMIDYIYKDLEKDITMHNSPLIGIGIGLPGHINPVDGVILPSCPFYLPESINYDFSIIAGVPVVIDNDANCCAWGVLERRKGSGLQNFLYSIVEVYGDKDHKHDRGLGFGIVINGDVYYGTDYKSGEVWDNIIGELDDETFFSQLFDKLSLFISFLNPSHLFLGGEYIKNKELVMRLVEERHFSRKCEVVFSDLKQYEISYGASSMFIERLFKIPSVNKYRDTDLTWEKILGIQSGTRI